MAWQARLASVTPLAVESDSLDLVVEYFDNASPERKIQKRIKWFATTDSVVTQLAQIRAAVDERCAALNRQDAMQSELESRVGTVVSS